jgi:homoserine/homoserine lactone efflux protein
MKSYWIFMLMAAATVASPGPGVVLTLTNSLRHGVPTAFRSILGVAAGAVVMATVSASSVGLLISTSEAAFTTVKLAGAAYLIYLGWKLWRSAAAPLPAPGAQPSRSGSRHFIEGLSLQFTNPKSILFFMSILPQFIEDSSPYFAQFAGLVLTYAGLVVVIHCIYALLAHQAQRWLASDGGSRAARQLGSAAFIFFGILLASSHR